MDFFLNIRRFKDFPCICPGFLEVFPAFIVDRDHSVRVERVSNLQSFFSIECETDRSHNGEARRADMQDGCSNFETLSDLMQTIEPNGIARDVERAVFLSRPFQNEAGGFTDDEVTS